MSGRVEYITNTAELAHMHACVAAIRDHLGGKPELVEVIKKFLTVSADSLKHVDAMTAQSLAQDARAILSRIENGNG